MYASTFTILSVISTCIENLSQSTQVPYLGCESTQSYAKMRIEKFSSSERTQEREYQYEIPTALKAIEKERSIFSRGGKRDNLLTTNKKIMYSQGPTKELQILHHLFSLSPLLVLGQVCNAKSPSDPPRS